MTPHQVLSLLTQDQTQELLIACCSYLSVDRIEKALRSGCEPIERRQLAFQLSIEFDYEGSADSGSS